MRSLRPLIQSVEEDFHQYAEKYQTTFWKIGRAILDKAYVGTMFDKKVVVHPDDSPEDNFDLIHETAEKLALLKPILQPDIYQPLQKLIRAKCPSLLKQVLLSLEPEDPQIELSGLKTAKGPDVPDWMADLINPEPEQDKTEETVSATGPTKQQINRDGPKRKICLEENHQKDEANKKRLKRNNSFWDKDTKRKTHKNELRDSIIMKAKAIFDYVIDDPQKDDPTLSTIISDCARFETAWLKCPNTAATVQSYSSEKLSSCLPRGSLQ